MTTCTLPRTAASAAAARCSATPAARAPARRLGWIERLAAWAERQPRHHQLGRWTAV